MSSPRAVAPAATSRACSTWPRTGDSTARSASRPPGGTQGRRCTRSSIAASPARSSSTSTDAATRSTGYETGAALGKRRGELPARADVELAEHLAQVVLDRPRTDEQLRTDLRVRMPLGGQPGDLRLLRRQQVPRLRREPAHGLARGLEFAAGAFGERLGAHRDEQLVGGAELLARVRAPALAAQPLAVEQAGARELDADPRA